jgi:hypothetical protein
MDDQLVTGTPAELVDARRTFSLPRPRVSARARELGLYGAAGVSYVALSVFFTPLMQFWMFGFAWLLLWVWGLPALARRLRRRR